MSGARSPPSDTPNPANSSPLGAAPPLRFLSQRRRILLQARHAILAAGQLPRLLPDGERELRGERARIRRRRQQQGLDRAVIGADMVRIALVHPALRPSRPRAALRTRSGREQRTESAQRPASEAPGRSRRARLTSGAAWPRPLPLRCARTFCREPAKLNVRQCRMARAALDWSQSDLAGASGVSWRTITRFEAGETILPTRVQ